MKGTIMTSSLHIVAGALLLLAASSVPAQFAGSRGAQVMQEGVSAATRTALAENAKDLARRTREGLVKTDTPLARSCNFLLGDTARLYDEHRLIDPSVHALRFREWMCQSGFRSRDALHEAGTALDVVNPDFGSMLGYLLKDDRDAFTRQMDQFCTAGYELQVDPAARENFERQARATMTDAYGTCLAGSVEAAIGKSAAFAYATPLDQSLQRYTLSVRWAHDAHDKRITSIKAEGARCEQAPRKAGDAQFTCTRSGNGTGVVSIATAQGTETVLLPSPADVARVALEERLLILRDRIQVLEQGLGKLSPQMLADLRDAARQ
jgi:hypothetical protein